MWLLYGFLSAFFASLMTLFMKLGLSKIDANLATTIRTTIVMILCWIMTLFSKNIHQAKQFSKNEWIYLILAAFSTFATWLFYFLSLKNGTTSKVLAIDKLSIVITIALSTIFLKEKLTIQMIIGLVVLVIGIILVVF